jgi:glucose-1-phosphate thymidylyltransferase
VEVLRNLLFNVIIGIRMKSMILASGFGTRLYPITKNQAKALLPYKGKPIINHIIDKINGDIDIVVNINSKFKNDFLQWQTKLTRQVQLCIEPAYSEEQRLGAIGSLNYWIKKLNISEDLLIIASDNYFEFNLPVFVSRYDYKNALVAVYDIGDKTKATEYGVVKLSGDSIIEFKEKPAMPESTTIATAIWLLPPAIFPLISEFCEKGNVDNLGNFITYILSKEQKVYAHKFDELWIDIGSVETYLATR